MRSLALAMLALLVGCSAPAPGAMEPEDAAGTGADGAPAGSDGGAGGDGAAPGDLALPAGLSPGSLTVAWRFGSANCNANADPEWQVHSYNATTYVLRQNKCDTFEAPFVYLFLGTQKAFLQDSGATATGTLRDAVAPLVGTLPLVVTHSHSHGDHTAGDASFAGKPATTVVAPSRAAVQAAFGIVTWPTQNGQLDLGGRVLDVVPLPGHEDAHVAVYDRQTGLLLTGDSLYPGLLTVRNWTSYRASVARLQQFAAAHPIAHILGTHVEMTANATVHYPIGTTYQPNEHALPLTRAHLDELAAALTALGSTAPTTARADQCLAAPRPLDASCRLIVHDDFVIYPL